MKTIEIFRFIGLSSIMFEHEICGKDKQFDIFIPT